MGQPYEYVTVADGLPCGVHELTLIPIPDPNPTRASRSSVWTCIVRRWPGMRRNGRRSGERGDTIMRTRRSRTVGRNGATVEMPSSRDPEYRVSHSTEGHALDSRAPTEGWSRPVLEQGPRRKQAETTAATASGETAAPAPARRRASEAWAAPAKSPAVASGGMLALRFSLLEAPTRPPR